MTPYRLGYWLKAIVAEIFSVDGYLFVNHQGLACEELVHQIATYASPQEAQRWMNIVLLDDFISETCGNCWKDADAKEVLDVFSLAWEYQVRAKYPRATVRIERVGDPEYGDLGLSLTGAIE